MHNLVPITINEMKTLLFVVILVVQYIVYYVASLLFQWPHIIFRKLLFKGLLLNYCLGITVVRLVVRCTPEGIKLDQLSHPEGIKANLIYLIGSITALSLTFPLDTLSYA